MCGARLALAAEADRELLIEWLDGGSSKSIARRMGVSYHGGTTRLLHALRPVLQDPEIRRRIIELLK